MAIKRIRKSDRYDNVYLIRDTMLKTEKWYAEISIDNKKHFKWFGAGDEEEKKAAKTIDIWLLKLGKPPKNGSSFKKLNKS